MATFNLSPPFATVLDGNGNVGAGWKLNFYEFGTTTRKDTYSDYDMATPHANPVVADADGRFPKIYINGSYKVVLTDESDVVIETDENYSGGIDIGVVLNDYIGQSFSDGQTILVTGRTVSGDGGDGYFYYDDSIARSLADGGTIVDPTVSLALQGTGSGTGCLIRIYKDEISVKWFGATGDGVTDDTDAVADAVTAMQPTRTAGSYNKVIAGLYFPEGDYLLDYLDLGNMTGFTVRGDSHVRTYLYRASGSTGLSTDTDSEAFIRINDFNGDDGTGGIADRTKSSDFTIRDLSIQNKDTQAAKGTNYLTGVYMSRCTYFRFVNVTWGKFGINLRTNHSWIGSFKSCLFRDSYDYHMAMTSVGDLNGVSFDDCYFLQSSATHASGSASLYLWRGERIVWTNCYFEGVHTYGVRAETTKCSLKFVSCNAEHPAANTFFWCNLSTPSIALYGCVIQDCTLIDNATGESYRLMSYGSNLEGTTISGYPIFLDIRGCEAGDAPVTGIVIDTKVVDTYKSFYIQMNDSHTMTESNKVTVRSIPQYVYGSSTHGASDYDITIPKYLEGKDLIFEIHTVAVASSSTGYRGVDYIARYIFDWSGQTFSLIDESATDTYSMIVDCVSITNNIITYRMAKSAAGAVLVPMIISATSDIAG